MTLKQEQAKKTRQDLLDAALVVFSKKGYNSTRLEDIAQQAGVTRGAFYWHFKNKSDVFSELHKQIMDDFFIAMKNVFDDALSPLQNLRNILYHTITTLLNNERTKRCGKLFYTYENAPDLVQVLNKLKKKTEQSVRLFFSDLIERGKKMKEIRHDISTAQIYMSATITFKGTIMHIFENISPVNAADVESIIDIYINGIKKQK